MAVKTMGDDLLIGAKEIARFVYDRDDRKSCRRIYSLQGVLPIFPMGNRIAARKSTLEAAIKRAILIISESRAPCRLFFLAASASCSTSAGVSHSRDRTSDCSHPTGLPRLDVFGSSSLEPSTVTSWAIGAWFLALAALAENLGIALTPSWSL
jgi:hypothetical protein